ncbi:hypothetical protein DN068_13830 [Taibaiella soli]|uniref:Uncharacterized protein n=1 Tax=Taibaiella soli TaxID=1649169 RepID=A0A2W2B938_9BACT|nr:hypothetical protein DN068_13830 [Taibaiella soli]
MMKNKFLLAVILFTVCFSITYLLYCLFDGSSIFHSGSKMLVSVGVSMGVTITLLLNKTGTKQARVAK